MKKPLISVVVCTKDGNATLPLFFEALAGQTLPKGVYEIIIVDDGSRQPIEKLISRHSCRIFRNEKSIGLAASRNLGYKNARADVVAFTDDDCVPDKHWLEIIVAFFSMHSDAVAVTGDVTTYRTEGLVLKYFHYTKPLSPLFLDLSHSTNILYRLLLYLKRQIHSAPQNETAVLSVVGANMAFRKHVLDAVGGFNSTIRFGGEEEELCYRLYHHPGRHNAMRFLPHLSVSHIFKPDIRSMLQRNYRYGIGNAKLRKMYHERSLTVYPFPFLFIAALLVAIILPATIVPAMLLPFLLYFHWPVRFVQKRDPAMLTFPFLQLFQESAHNIGWFEETFRSERS